MLGYQLLQYFGTKFLQKIIISSKVAKSRCLWNTHINVKVHLATLNLVNYCEQQLKCVHTAAKFIR